MKSSLNVSCRYLVYRQFQFLTYNGLRYIFWLYSGVKVICIHLVELYFEFWIVIFFQATNMQYYSLCWFWAVTMNSSSQSVWWPQGRQPIFFSVLCCITNTFSAYSISHLLWVYQNVTVVITNTITPIILLQFVQFYGTSRTDVIHFPDREIEVLLG
jgi:hypothetical protein